MCIIFNILLFEVLKSICIYLFIYFKQVVLKHDPIAEIKSKGVFAGIYHEKEMWEVHIHSLESIKMQLNSAEAREIVCHLEQAKSMYGKSIASVTQDVKKVSLSIV